MVLVCAERGDAEQQANQLLTRLLVYRVFCDDAGKMNRSVTDVRGGLLLVPQFTLAADTRSGTRPSCAGVRGEPLAFSLHTLRSQSAPAVAPHAP